MDVRFYSLGVVFVLLSFMQLAVTQEDDAPPPEETCPPLDLTSMKVACKSNDGIVPCTDIKVGVKARPFWKKNVARNNKRGPTTLVCRPGGVWKPLREQPPSTTTTTTTTTTTQATTTVSTTTTTTVRPDAPGYTVLPGFGAYKFTKFNGHLESANESCRADRTRLFVVDSRAELEAVYSKLLEPNADAFRGLGLFLGVRQTPQGPFRNEFGELFPGTSGLRWKKGEPSTRSDEGCVFIDIPGFQAMDCPCIGHAANIVCERPLK